jgi:hypothetical protein
VDKSIVFSKNTHRRDRDQMMTMIGVIVVKEEMESI